MEVADRDDSDATDDSDAPAGAAEPPAGTSDNAQTETPDTHTDAPTPGTHTETLARLHRRSGQLATAALRRLDDTLPWYRDMPPAERSWVGLVAQAGISAFTAWYADQRRPPEITADVFGTAPRELTRSVTLRQTLGLVRAVVEVVERHVDVLAPHGQVGALREAVLRYSREVAFAVAEVYAQAAEARGAWDARLEALVVDALLRGESDDALQSRVAALGWTGQPHVLVVAGQVPDTGADGALDELRRGARAAADDALVGVQGDRLVAVLGSTGDPRPHVHGLARHFAPGPVVTGPVVAGLGDAARSARAALSGLVAARAWPGAPRPVSATELLPERVLAGDVAARRAMVDEVYRPLVATGTAMAGTVAAYLEHGRSLEATARTLFVHPNTVRYRLRRVAETTGWDATESRDAFVLQTALAVGLLAGSPGGPPWGPRRTTAAPAGPTA